MSFVSEQFGEDQIESPSNLRPGFHGRAEARRRRTRALHCDDEFVGTAVRVGRIAELVLEQNTVLHCDRRQFACADSQKCKRMFGLRLAIQDPKVFSRRSAEHSRTSAGWRYFFQLCGPTAKPKKVLSLRCMSR